MDIHSKKELRKHIRNLKAKYTHLELEQMSQKAIQHLEDNATFVEAKKVLIYYPLEDEVNTKELLLKWSKHKTLFLPKVDHDILTIHPYNGQESLQEGAFHIMEPNTQEIHDYSDIDLVVVPGMAFTLSGHRLGRGKGFYDRLLSRKELINVKKIGLAFSFQILPDVIDENHDVMMDEVITN